MRYLLFLLVTAALFIRPGELVPALAGVQVYLFLILACLVVSMPVVLQEFSRRFPGVPPVAACTLALFPAVLLSHMSHGRADAALFNGIDFVKLIIYFLLLISLVDDAAKLRKFLGWTGICTGLLAVVTVINFHGFTSMPVAEQDPDAPRAKKLTHGYSVKERVWDSDAGRMVEVERMCGTGIWNDPNDLGLAFVTAMPVCLCGFTNRRSGIARLFWLGLLLYLGYALTLTHSRGAFLALLAGLAALFHSRFGTRRTVLLGTLFLPVLLVLFAGRMTTFSASEGTGQGRIQLWSDGLTLFTEAPLFGVGMEMYRQRISHVAHNSFIHSFAEFGLVGGALFLGAFYFALRGLWQLQKQQADAVATSEDDADDRPEPDPELVRMQPYLISMLVIYAVGISFLSRSYVVPTYMMLGLAVVFLRLRVGTVAVPWAPAPQARPLPFPFMRLAGISMAFLVATFVFVRMFVRWG